MPVSPTAEGFRTAFRRPVLTLAELAWRWTAGATAVALFFFGLVQYLDTLPVSGGELLFLRSRQPYLVAEAIAHILRGSLGRAVMSAVLAAFMLGALWIVAASFGRIATVRALVDYFRRDVGQNSASPQTPGPPPRDVTSNVSTPSATINAATMRALLRLNFLRVATALAAVVAVVGAMIVAGFASPDNDPQPWLAFFLFLPLAFLVALAWWTLNWILSLACLFAIRDGEDAVGAIGAAVAFCRERAAAVFAVTGWTILAHLVAFGTATIVASMPLGMLGAVPWRVVLLGVTLVTVIYFAFADWLYMARLAGYVFIAEAPEALFRPVVARPPVVAPILPTPPPVAVVLPLQTTIDRDETILSDIPNPPVET